jgi:gas vesicle protein
MDSIQRTGLVTQTVIERFDSYISELSHAQESGAQLSEQTASILSGMHQDVALQNQRYQALQDAQADLSRQMEQYAAWSGRVLEAVEKQSDKASDRAHEVANEMNRSGKLLQESYASFVENISSGLARTMGLFEENMRDMTVRLIKDMKSAAEKAGETAPMDMKGFSRVQQALNDMTQALTRATRAAEQMAEGA